MNIREYYLNTFSQDLHLFMGNTTVPYFGHSWRYDCRSLDRVPASNREAFLICLYFTVLTDQAMHCHFRTSYSDFEALTRYPKFCHGLRQFQHNPREILLVPTEMGNIQKENLKELLPAGMELFVDEVISFFKEYMPQISPADFFEKLVYDSDVQIPELIAMVDPTIREDVVYIAYKELRNAIKAVGLPDRA